MLVLSFVSSGEGGNIDFGLFVVFLNELLFFHATDIAESGSKQRELALFALE